MISGASLQFGMEEDPRSATRRRLPSISGTRMTSSFLCLLTEFAVSRYFGLVSFVNLFLEIHIVMNLELSEIFGVSLDGRIDWPPGIDRKGRPVLSNV